MTTYEKIDPILQEWASLHGVAWFNKYQDTEVRTFFLESSDVKKNVQIWLEILKNENIIIHITDNNKIGRNNKKYQINTKLENLKFKISEALDIAKKLI